jgi:uncharacterized protein (TIGR00296 family)
MIMCELVLKGSTRLFSLTDEEGKYIVRLARATIENKLGLSEAPNVADAPKVTQEKCGVFVTLNKLGPSSRSLRGCIGYPLPYKMLINALMESALNAAFDDPRFPPVKASEMERITVEVSVLTPPEVIHVGSPQEYPGKVKVGEDGLIIGRGMRRGLLLPQVASEWGWDSEELLSQCCLKAGLPPDAWLLEGTQVEKFQAIIFGEESPRGKVSRHILD